VMRHFRPSLREHGLTEQQWRILRALAASGEIEVTELARMAYLLGPSLSRILRDLESRKLIERRLLKADLRRSIVSITAKGLKLIEAVAPSSEAIYAEMTKQFGARKLSDMLSELESCLLAMPAGSDSEDDAED
jgi:homoprotocatechuate degradation regulator HpaR